MYIHVRVHTLPAASNSKPPRVRNGAPRVNCEAGTGPHESPQGFCGTQRGPRMRGTCRGQTLRGPTKPPQQNQEQLYTSVNMNTFYDSVNCWLKSDSSHQFLWLLTWLDLDKNDSWLDLTWVNLTWRHCKSRPRQPKNNFVTMSMPSRTCTYM